jgi:two-component sensor histidine kinase
VHEQSFAVDDIAFLQAVANLLSESILRTDAEETLSDSETRLQALASELDHRVKNILARFSVIVQRARDDAHSVEELSEGLSGRIDSMVRTQALLSRAEWKSMPLRVLIDAELKPYASADNISIDCERVVVNPTAAQALSMVFHELATNAAKFGALARSTGSIAIAARTVPSTMPAGSETLLIEWQEKGGPVVKPPQREGFGSEVIKGLLTHELDAEVKVTYEAEGLRCDIAIPRNKIAGP